jgi:hypothetical protein
MRWLIGIERQAAVEGHQLAHIRGLAELIEPGTEFFRRRLSGEQEQDAARLIDAPAARIPAAACFLSELEILRVEPQVFFTELARNQTDGQIDLAVARRSGEQRALRIDPLPRGRGQLAMQPGLQQFSGCHAASCKGWTPAKT